jgi:inorganic pyrophosphatase
MIWCSSITANQFRPGRNPPIEINILIEIPQGGIPVKYELDKRSPTHNAQSNRALLPPL